MGKEEFELAYCKARGKGQIEWGRKINPKIMAVTVCNGEVLSWYPDYEPLYLDEVKINQRPPVILEIKNCSKDEL